MSDILRNPRQTPIHRGPLAAMEMVAGSSARPPVFLPAELEVGWFRTASYTVALTHAGAEVGERSSWCDGDILFAGLDNAIEQARRCARQLRVTSSSSLHVELRLSLLDVPNMPRPRPSYSSFDHWAELPSDLYHRDLDRGARWLAMTADQREAIDWKSGLRRIAPIELLANRTIWSTHPAEGADAALRALRREFLDRPFEVPALAEA